MGALDRFMNKAKASAQAAGQKAGEWMEIGKLSMALADLNSDVERLYAEIGRMVYDAYKDKETSTEELNIKCEYIDEKLTEIAELRRKIAELKKVKQCPVCGESNPHENLYCAQCGAKLEEEEEPHIVVDDFVVDEEQEEAPAVEAAQPEVTEEEKKEDTAE